MTEPSFRHATRVASDTMAADYCSPSWSATSSGAGRRRSVTRYPSTTTSGRPDPVAELLAQAGLDVRAGLLREPEEDELTPRAYLVARKPAEVSQP